MAFRRASISCQSQAIAVAVSLFVVAGCGRSNTDVDGPAEMPAVEQRGEPIPFDGYTLFQPLRSTSVYLVGMDGGLAHRWKTELNPGQSVYLLDSGNLLRAARSSTYRGPFQAGGAGGIVQEIAWDGRVVWQYQMADQTRRAHHDIEPMPNGNVLIIAWELKTLDQAVAAGIDPRRLADDAIWSDVVVEVEPIGPNGGRIVWEWRAWDHLIQQYDPTRAGYGDVSGHPELIDINAATAHRQRQQQATPERIEWLRALGYLEKPAEPDERTSAGRDWLHTNAVDYHQELDQILLSVRNFNEVWIVDHSTTTAEAASHAGGRSGKGGDLLYRWGNPAAHGAGTAEDQRLFAHHDARWIPEGHPGAGNILVFNNGRDRPGRDYSTVDEIVPPIDADGRYRLDPGRPAEPDQPGWFYAAPDPASMYSSHVAGAQRLANGNTLIAVGVGGRMLEIGAGDQVVWEYVNPYTEDERPRARRQQPGADSGPAPGSIYRATRLGHDHPGLARLTDR